MFLFSSFFPPFFPFLTIQDVFKHFYNTKSAREKGTLYHLRELFDRRGVKTSAKDAVKDTREFLQFITHGYVILALMHVLGIDKESLCDVPSEKDSLEVKHNYLNTICSTVVN